MFSQRHLRYATRMLGNPVSPLGVSPLRVFNPSKCRLTPPTSTASKPSWKATFEELAFTAKDFPPRGWRLMSPSPFSDEESDDDAADLPPSSPLSGNSNNSAAAAAAWQRVIRREGLLTKAATTSFLLGLSRPQAESPRPQKSTLRGLSRLWKAWAILWGHAPLQEGRRIVGVAGSRRFG
ncbi:hypothetical protein BKA56DRAFT_616138 [Ilyonectria sp. MPI-CAGE-AT-0026]|nr:hypothetical protein BKA56DRAFT_616138 [Ilyonectria sp. MPI-CAGE-AT-0026]